jgi:hypothetical protein
MIARRATAPAGMVAGWLAGVHFAVWRQVGGKILAGSSLDSEPNPDIGTQTLEPTPFAAGWPAGVGSPFPQDQNLPIFSSCGILYPGTTVIR